MSFFIDIGCRLWSAAEPGFFEHTTHTILKDALDKMGFVVEDFTGIPGFVATITGNWKDAEVALITDMDALPLSGGGYRHMCGHHQQMTALVATALEFALEMPEILPRIAFIALPAEEYVELERRSALQSDGKITHLSGKLEMLSRGLFDNFKAVVAMHSANLPETAAISSVRLMNGFDEMSFAFSGVSAHAGAHPHKGKNAQNAASLFLQACALLRETFDEHDHIRIHPVLRIPAEQPVSFIPDDVRAETFVRASTPEAVDRVAKQLEAAARGCAEAIGVTVEIKRRTGYAPLHTDPALHELARKVAIEHDMEFFDEPFGAASTDVGNISQVKPAIIIGLPGTNAKFHHPDFFVTDEHLAYEFPAAFLVPFLMAILEQGENG